jgi:hypothetical protein
MSFTKRIHNNNIISLNILNLKILDIFIGSQQGKRKKEFKIYQVKNHDFKH